MLHTTTRSVDRAEVVRCGKCRAEAELFVSMANQKDGRVLRIFKCECGKLTSTVDRA